MKKRFFNCLLIFLIFSFLGAVIEFCYGSLSGGGMFYDKTIYILLNIKIPFIPIYGFGAILLILVGNFLDNKKVSFWCRGLINGVVITIFELLGGILSLVVLKRNLWDYSNHFLNLNGMVSFPMLILWIIAGYLFSFVYMGFKENKKLKRFIQIL